MRKMLGTLQYQQLFSPEKIQEIETYFADLAETNKSIAHAFFTAPRPLYNLALHYYNAAILIYMNLLPDTSHDRQLPLYSNLIITSRKLNDFISCDRIYNKVRSTLYPTTHQHKTLWDKIYFNTASAKLTLAEEMKKNPHIDSSKTLILYDEISALKDCLSENSREFAINLSNRLNSLGKENCSSRPIQAGNR